MRPEHLKLAGIVTVVCGAMSPMVAGATNDDSPTTFAGRIVPLRGMTQDLAPNGIEDDAQDGTAAPQGSAPEVAQTGQAPDVASTAEPQPAPTTNAAADNAQASSASAISEQDVRAPSQDGADSGDVSGAAGASAQNAASTPPDPAGSAREPNVAADNETSKPVVAEREDSDRAWSSPDLVAVSDSRLDNLRGGFDLPSGLVVSFGISREAFVNGTLVTSTSFNIPNVAQMTPQQAQMVASANSGALIQNGLNNTVQPGGLPAVTGSVIQNTLSNQQIQALTTINASVNSLSTFKAMNLGATLNNALLNVVRPR